MLRSTISRATGSSSMCHPLSKKRNVTLDLALHLSAGAPSRSLGVSSTDCPATSFAEFAAAVA
jgi:hypothetical protein